MKLYEVLDGHTGDKEYRPGGTRVADPAAVQHLVTLGVLKELGDAPDQASTDAASTDRPITDFTATMAADLVQQVEALTQERDDARAELGTLRELQRGSEGDLATLRQQVEALMQELAARSTLQPEPPAPAPATAVKPASAPAKKVN